ncbi:MAG: MBL fold metallo-hydrolase [Proteobacteria bacterium]|nr:MBL fold metallo-hydrolase [Pseudomonadota bacterium]MBU4469740.1 MBL fold metallo-hydrolase [Pseudomonadota bacterium]MCG2753880.1 MBL fold metallo-hydrolase [Desulfobacteraceae bacterium]
MIIKMLTVGPIMANCYILGCERTKLCAVIDPGGDEEDILMALAKLHLTVKYILNTHGHFDHVGGNKGLKDATGAEILIHTQDAPMLGGPSPMAFGMGVKSSPPPDRTIQDGDTIEFGDITLSVIHTPGHTPGGVSFLTQGAVFVGDTLFAGSVGRTDFPGGNFATLAHSIQKKLFVLGDDVVVYPGHMGPTKIGEERKYNPFVGADTL